MDIKKMDRGFDNLKDRKTLRDFKISSKSGKIEVIWCSNPSWGYQEACIFEKNVAVSWSLFGIQKRKKSRT